VRLRPASEAGFLLPVVGQIFVGSEGIRRGLPFEQLGEKLWQRNRLPDKTAAKIPGDNRVWFRPRGVPIAGKRFE